MISASTLVGAYPRVRPVGAANVSAVPPSATMRRTAPSAPVVWHPGGVLEPLLLVLTIFGASLLFCTAIAGMLP
jgi:hypothetical protein